MHISLRSLLSINSRSRVCEKQELVLRYIGLYGSHYRCNFPEVGKNLRSDAVLKAKRLRYHALRVCPPSYIEGLVYATIPR